MMNSRLVDLEELQFQHPFTAIVSAPTKSGKTEFVKKLLLNKEYLIKPTPIKVYWVYGEWQPAYEELKKKSVQFLPDLPDMDDLKSGKDTPQMLILDDKMVDMKNDPRLTMIFSRGCHHWNMSVIHIVQNAFFAGLRTSRINAQYLVLMKNPSDRLQIQTLGRQLFVGSKHFLEAYEDATKRPYGYLLVDLAQSTPEELRLRTNIFPKETQFAYTRKF